MDPDRVRKLTIQISGEIGSGKSLISGIIYTALKEAIPNCMITCTEEGERLHPEILTDVLTTVTNIKARKESIYSYNILLDVHSPPEM